MQLNHSRVARQSNWVVRRYPRSQRAWARLHAKLLVISGGRILPKWFSGAPVMVLETVGRRSGDKRSTPVLYLRDGDALVVLAANAGADRTPDWWLNLREAGHGHALIGGRRSQVKPRLLEGAERDRLWRAFAQMYPQAEYYRRFTDRDLPLVALEPDS